MSTRVFNFLRIYLNFSESLSTSENNDTVEFSYKLSSFNTSLTKDLTLDVATARSGVLGDSKKFFFESSKPNLQNLLANTKSK